MQPESHQPATGMLDGPFRQIDPPQGSARLGKLLMIRAESHPNLQQAQTSGFLKSCEIQDVGFQAVSHSGLGDVALLLGIPKMKRLAAGRLVPIVVN
ncbi:hypothetical protein [Candidatus Thiosymbion oneisti]|uniref:hypothetical protein n=1 Tax=Candidatus Thiosymbion oneisti TaxID=589554 RepID=UPI001C403A09|nr:hypothetical protein [Candidatus Thiosymbion oneisti]